MKVSGLAIGKIADDGIRALINQKEIFIGLIVMLIFAQSLGLYGLIVSLIIAA
jgi:V-type H+-transporting ATPase 16kDa proteolipid subunit